MAVFTVMRKALYIDYFTFLLRALIINSLAIERWIRMAAIICKL